MKTKEMKFLAVLAVLAMAFATAAAVVEVQPGDAETVLITGFDKAQIDPEEIDAALYEDYQEFYITQDMTVKVKTAVLQDQDVTFYVQNGAELQVDMKAAAGEQEEMGNITIITVTGDRTVDVSGSGGAGKIEMETTSVQYVPAKGQSVYYTAATVEFYPSYDLDTATFEAIDPTVSTLAEMSADVKFAAAPVVGADVQVADGQTVESAAEIANLVYGVLVQEAADHFTYYAVGNNAGTVSFADVTSVTVVEGSATVTTSDGLSVAKMKDFVKKEDEALVITQVITADQDPITYLNVNGTMNKGDLSLSGKVKTTMTKMSGTATIANKAAIQAGSTMVVGGTLYIKNNDASNLTVTGAGTVVAQNQDLWNADHDGIQLTYTDDGFTGKFDVTAISQVTEVRKNFTSANVAIDATFEVIGDTELYTLLTVAGTLIIDEGVTLKVNAGALLQTADVAGDADGRFIQIINKGKIVVKMSDQNETPAVELTGGNIINEGTIEINSKAVPDNIESFTIGADVKSFSNKGTISVMQKDTVSFAKMSNSGTFEMKGTIGESTITNSGKVTIAGAVAGDLTVKMSKKDAVLDLSSAKVAYSENAAATITVNNAGMKNADDEAGVSIVTITQADGFEPDQETGEGSYTIKGMKFTAAVRDDEDENPTIDISGFNVTATPKQADAFVAIAITKYVDVSGTLSVPALVALDVSAADLLVSGTMSVAKGAEVTANGVVAKITGKLTFAETDAFDGQPLVSAAKYSVEDGSTYIYTTFDNAYNALAEMESSTITIMGSVGNPYYIEGRYTIPADMTIDGDFVAIGSYFMPGNITLSTAARIMVTDVEVLNGSLYASDSGDISSDVGADIKEEGEEDILYQSLAFALGLASSGDVIELNRDVALYYQSLTIPAGVTVDATTDESGNIVFIGSDLNIQGTLVVEGFTFVAVTTEDIGITVDGMFMEKDSGVNIANKWFTPVGVSYMATIEDEEGEETDYFIITSIANLQTAVLLAENGEVTVEGDAKLGDVSISGTEDVPAIVTFRNDVSAGTLTLSNAVIVANPGSKVTATFADALGSIVIKGAYVGANTLRIYSESAGVYMSGPITDSANSVYSIQFNGLTGMDGAVIGWGNYEGDQIVYPTVTFAGDTLAIGKKNKIENTVADEPTNILAGTVTIAGSLTADNAAKIEIIADTELPSGGSLIALEKTETSTAGAIDVQGHLFVGATKASVYDAKAAASALSAEDEQEHGAPAEFGYPTQAGSVVSGKVELMTGKFMAVLAGSNVDEDILEDLEGLEIAIDGEEWMTVYGDGETPFYLDGLRAPIVDSKVEKIVNQDGTVVALYSDKYKVIYGSQPLNLGIDTDVAVIVQYDVFTVTIKTDGTIKAVYIDDVLMVNEKTNVYEMDRVIAGKHVVKVEPVTGYSADKCYLFRDDGEKLTGMTFIFDREDCTIDEDGNYTYDVVYNVAGTEVIPEPEPEPVTPEEKSEWTITTILLCILVVLIAIMAVIVALRLNRS